MTTRRRKRREQRAAEYLDRLRARLERGAVDVEYMRLRREVQIRVYHEMRVFFRPVGVSESPVHPTAALPPGPQVVVLADAQKADA